MVARLAAAARAIVGYLAATGMGHDELAELAGVAVSDVDELVDGTAVPAMWVLAALEAATGLRLW